MEKQKEKKQKIIDSWKDKYEFTLEEINDFRELKQGDRLIFCDGDIGQIFFKGQTFFHKHHFIKVQYFHYNHFYNEIILKKIKIYEFHLPKARKIIVKEKNEKKK
jgi:hypothetical protein